MPKILLLADDSVVIQKLVGLSFANEDVEVITTDNGDDALARAREVRPDLVLADVVMPGKSGYEVCEAVKADADLRHIPVLLLTGSFEAFDEDRARQVGSDGHLAKPFETQDLVDRVMGLLSQAPAATPSPTRTPERDDAVVADSASVTPVTQTAASGDGAYEFFDDDTSEDTAVPGVGAATPPPLASTNPDDAFDFGLDLYPIAATDPNAGEQDTLDPNFELGSNAPGDVTVAIVPEGEPSRSRQASDPNPIEFGEGIAEDDFLAPPPAEVTSLDASLTEPVSAAVPVTDFEFGFDEPSAASLDDLTSRLAMAPDLGLEPTSASTGLPGPDISQVMRDRIHETLEKIAWEAFADVSDSIVRQVLERVESIVWEVVPQMAEALVREEIRRIKGDD